jgi:hypothetical protein
VVKLRTHLERETGRCIVCGTPSTGRHPTAVEVQIYSIVRDLGSIGIDVLDRQLDVSAGIEAMVDIVQGFAVTGSVVV